VFGDFVVCPLEKDTPGAKWSVSVKSARNPKARQAQIMKRTGTAKSLIGMWPNTLQLNPGRPFDGLRVISTTVVPVQTEPRHTAKWSTQGFRRLQKERFC
jgi:hypothetical protein